MTGLRLRGGSGRLRRGGFGGKRGDLGSFADATFNKKAYDDGDANNDSGDDGLFKFFPAALFDIQFKTGRNLKRVLGTHNI